MGLTPSCLWSSGASGGDAKARTPKVLVITDIGSDFDDTLALLALIGLHHAQRVQLVGAVASGGNGRLRAAVVRGWLRRGGISDCEVPVAGYMGGGREECYVPEETPLVEHADLWEDDAASLILQLARKHKQNLLVFAIGPLGPLAAALNQDANALKNIGALCIQGQAITKKTGIDLELLPDIAAYNLREDFKSAQEVFSLQDDVKFHLLGKFAAYRVGIYESDFVRWSKALGNNELIDGVRGTLEVFKKGNPTLFRTLYPAVVDGRDEVLSHPYDALLVLSALDSKHYDVVTFPFQSHTLIGNTPEKHGVSEDAKSAVHAELCQWVGAGVAACRAHADKLQN